MKKLSIISLIAFVAIVTSSCSSSNNVVSNHGISKRKYTKGFFFQRKSNLKTADSNVKNADLKENKTLAKAERTEARKTKKTLRIEKVNENSVVAANEAANVSFDETTAEKRTEEPSVQQNVGSDSDGIDAPVTENSSSESEESVKSTTVSNSSSNSSGRAGGSGVGIIILVILAIIIPPLAVYLYEDITTRFWIDLIMALVGYGVGFGLLGGIGGLLGLVAVIYALLIVLEVI